MMKRGHVAAALLVPVAAISWAAVRTAPAALSPAPSAEALGFDAQRLARLDTYMSKTATDGRVAGILYLLARHGQVVDERSYGVRSLATGAPMSRDTIFRFYSMSKPITGVAMMMLFEEGRWRLDEPITDFIPEFKSLKVMTGKNADGTLALEPVKRPPTMRHL